MISQERVGKHRRRSPRHVAANQRPSNLAESNDTILTITTEPSSTAAPPPNARLLARFRFGDSSPARDPRDFHVPLALLAGGNCGEAWWSEAPVRTGSQDQSSYAYNDTMLIGQCEAIEGDFGDLAKTTRAVYERAFDLMRTLGYPHPLRFWNYIPFINRGAGDRERYKRFCSGRRDWLETGALPGLLPPAATAVGTRDHRFVLHFLASRIGGVHVENPRQLSAYHYPPQYSVRPPAFSRATCVGSRGRRQLYISGTASIVGHVSRHDHDVDAQFVETLHNLDAVTAHCEIAMHGGGVAADTLRPQHLRVYLRRPAQLASVREGLRASKWAHVPAVYLRADICRRELSIEIEAVCGTPNRVYAPRVADIDNRASREG